MRRSFAEAGPAQFLSGFRGYVRIPGVILAGEGGEGGHI
jgi:hypothetical protein